MIRQAVADEPHYSFAFLSWLPRSWRSPYLHWSGKGDFHDCEPLELGQLERILAALGLEYRNLCIDEMGETLEVERPAAWMTRYLRRLPDGLLKPFRGLIPTLIYSVEKNGHYR